MMSLFCLKYNNYTHAQAAVVTGVIFFCELLGARLASVEKIALTLDSKGRIRGTHSARFSHCAFVIAYNTSRRQMVFHSI